MPAIMHTHAKCAAHRLAAWPDHLSSMIGILISDHRVFVQVNSCAMLQVRLHVHVFMPGEHRDRQTICFLPILSCSDVSDLQPDAEYRSRKEMLGVNGVPRKK